MVLPPISSSQQRDWQKPEHPSFFYMEEFVLDLSVEDLQLLYKSVCIHLEKWPGGDPAEQEHLMYMKSFLFRYILETKL